MKIALVFLFLVVSTSTYSCDCLKGEVINLSYSFKKEISGFKIVNLKITGNEEMMDKKYRKVYWDFEQEKPDSLIGYMRMDSSCERMYYLDYHSRSEDLIYDMSNSDYLDFRIRFHDGMHREFYMYFRPKQIEALNGARIVELNGPNLSLQGAGNLKFIENIGPNCLFFLGPLDINTTILGLDGILVSKMVDGKEVYTISEFHLHRHRKRKLIVDIELITSVEMNKYISRLDHSDKEVLNSINSSKDIYLILENLNWNERDELASKLVDHPECDKGAAMLAFWYNVPNHFIEKGFKNPSYSRTGYELTQKLYNRFYINYYTKEENYFKPDHFKFEDYEDIIKIPLELKMPVRGVKYVIRD